MNPQEWDRIERVYHEALALEPAARGAFLDHACADDAAIRREVESLLGLQSSAEPFLERSALHDAATLIAPADPLRPPPRIPGYTIIELIGEGGMGVVYLADQEAPLQRRVALKLIRPGMDSRQVVERFETERQALARMDHPNIAAVFDAGTTDDGRPFFVMEFVPGVPITEYCDRERLSTRDRLELFLQVCAAVQHAHQKGVIHRDLKPSNVLVSSEEGRARPKVIDFGIAKAVQLPVADRTGLTEQGTLVGTPEYMSPEQAAFSQDIDTTSDVYTLGVLLYELLVGALPFDSKALREAGHDEMRRVIRESDPPRPSSRLTDEDSDPAAVAAVRRTDVDRLVRALRGDLDWVVLKALEKDRGRRYPTAAALAADVERYLTDKPLEARPPSAAYRVRKFTRRYRGAVAAAAAILLVLVAGLSASLTQYGRAERQRAEADRQRAHADSQRAAAETASAEATARRAEAERATAEVIAQRNEATLAKTDATRQQLVALRQAESADEARREAEYRAYVATIVAADGELRANLHGAARERLLGVAPDERDWEWRHLYLKSDTSLMTLESGSPCESWTVTNRGPLLQGPRSPGAVLRFAWRSAGALFLHGSATRVSLRQCNRVDSWDVARGGVPSSREVAGPVLATSATDDILMLVSTDARPVRWELHILAAGSASPVARVGPFDAQPTCAALSPDGRQIAVGLLPALSQTGWLQDDIFEVWDTRTAQRRARMVPAKPPQDTRSPGTCLVTFSPDSTRVATSGATVGVWRTESGDQIATDGVQSGRVSQPIAFSPDGTRLAIGRLSGLVDVLRLDGSAQLEHLQGGGFVRELPLRAGDRYFLVDRRRRNEVLSIAFSPDGKRIVTGTDVNVGVWDLAQRSLVAVMPGHDSEVIGVGVASDGHILTADVKGTVKLWPPSLSGEMTVLPGTFISGPASAVVSADGTVAALARLDGGLEVWARTQSSPTVLRPGGGTIDSSKWMRSLAVSWDGRRLLVGENDAIGTVRTHVLPSGETTGAVAVNPHQEPGCELPSPNKHYPVYRMALSPDSRSLALQDGNCLIVRDWPSLRIGAKLNEYPSAFAFRPDGTLVVTSYPQQGLQTVQMRVEKPVATTFRIWDWKSSSVLAEAPAPAASGPDPASWRIALSSDGRRVGFMRTAGTSPTSSAIVSIWDGNLNREISRLSVPRDTVGFALSPDGRRVATTHRLGTVVRLWDTDRRQLLLTLTDDDQVTEDITFTPDGRLIVGRASGGLTVWETQKRTCGFCLPGRAK